MCIVSVAWRAHPNWPLVAIGNRDELHSRPGDPLMRWEDPDHLLAGRDRLAGGTWLGVSEQGRFAVITNVAGHEQQIAPRSRGLLMSHFLSNSGAFKDLGMTQLDLFNPFNLITIDGDRARLVSNQPNPISQDLSPGIYGLSNGPIDNPWPKSEVLDNGLRQWLDDDRAPPSQLLDLLHSDETYAGSSEDSDHRNSPIFIRNSVYGTRCSTYVLVDHQGDGTICERRFNASGEITGETSHSFRWP